MIPVLRSFSGNSRAIAGVTFDAAGTLIEPWPSVGEIYRRVASEYGWSAPAAGELNRRFAQAWQSKGAFDYSRAGWIKLVGQTFGRQIPDDLFAQLYARFKQPDVWRVYDEVPAVLKALRGRGLVLGVVSNWDERLGPLLQALDLASFFQAIVISAEVGQAKPDPRIFAVARRRLGVPAKALLHVGDQDDEDVAGARGAGWSALRIDRRRRTPEALADLSPLPEMFRFAR